MNKSNAYDYNVSDSNTLHVVPEKKREVVLNQLVDTVWYNKFTNKRIFEHTIQQRWLHHMMPSIENIV